MAGLTLLLATMLVIANKKLHVEEDPRIDVLEEMLPNANCGACGQPGCRAFAEALAKGEVTPAECTVSTLEAKEQIATFLGVDVGQAVKRVARLACAGGKNVARHRALYVGDPTCRGAAQVAGGGKSCAWGCLGFGDCEKACTFDVIIMNAHDLPVVDEDQCTACEDCVIVCPKDLFSIQPVTHQLWVACKNLEAGDEITEYCEVACTACARCAMDAPNGAVVMQNNLPVIDYSISGLTKTPIERCPTGAIVWIEKDGSVVKGKYSKKIIRQEPLRAVPS
jgi:RnfABCDGE-type electron transport complex B subunit